MTPKRFFLYLLLTALILASNACTLQGLPYPTATEDPKQITPDLEATREIVESGMFPSATPEPTSPPPADSPTPEEPTPAPTAGSFRIPSLTLKLAFLKEGNLWYWEEGEDLIQLTTSGDAYLVALSADASQAAYAREIAYDSRELWVINTDGTENRVLVDAPAFKEMTHFDDDLTGGPLQLDWVAGTDLVIFSTRLIYEGPGMPRIHETRTVNTVSRTMTVLAEKDHGGLYTLSPDGKKAALVLPDRISVVNTDGSQLRELYAFPHVNTESEWWYYPPLAWTENGSAVRVVIPPQNPMFERDLPTEVIQLPLDGSLARTVREVQTIPVLFGESIISADARQLAFIAPAESQDMGSGILNTVSVLDDSPAPYDQGQIALYAWSPDNRHFLYRVNGSNRIGQIGEPKTSLKAGGDLIKLEFVDPGHFLFLTLTPDGEKLWLGDLEGETYLIAVSSTGVDFDFVK